MASFAQRGRWFGWRNITGAPTIEGANDEGSVIIVTFSETLRAGPVLSQFAATVAAVARTITAVAVSGRQLRLTLASAPTAGQAVVVTYTQDGTAGNRLADTYGDQVASGQLANFAA